MSIFEMFPRRDTSRTPTGSRLYFSTRFIITRGHIATAVELFSVRKSDVVDIDTRGSRNRVTDVPPLAFLLRASHTRVYENVHFRSIRNAGREIFD